MQRLEDDGLDELGWLFGAVTVLMLLFSALVYVLLWKGLLQ